MISPRIASDAREVETVELALFIRHHSNGWLVLEEVRGGAVQERRARDSLFFIGQTL